MGDKKVVRPPKDVIFIENLTVLSAKPTTEVYNLVKLTNFFYPRQKPKDKSPDFVLLTY